MKMNSERSLTWITVDEMRRYLSISRTKAYEIATSGCVETVKIGRCLRINARSLNHWLESQRYPKA
jgi:excisionase family DNA binding protein